jgi:hypothetical protein
MFARSTLASRFSKNQSGMRSSTPLSDDQIRHYAPSIFAAEKHSSRSDRYTCIPTIDVLHGLQKEGFQPFMVCQTRTRDEGKREFAKHMVRMRHASQINAAEANEIIVLNSADGSSSYQLLGGQFRFVCSNGLVSGDVNSDVRIKHMGDVISTVVAGAYDVLEGFERIENQRDGMKALTLNNGEQAAFANAALALRYDTDIAPAPVTEAQILQPHRRDDMGGDLWRTFNTVQEHIMGGGLRGRNATGKRTTTRAVGGIDQSVKLNRALWILAEAMAKLKA